MISDQLKNSSERILGLDLLRGIAILLVLFRHSSLEENVLQQIGWLGVDLFFVLSGFLISTLLFQEYSNTQNVDIFRFLFRRSFKILPSFYFFLTVFLGVELFFYNSNFTWKQLVSEFFYLQSYFTGTCNHTWSLAVEEHFYILFSILIFILNRLKIIQSKFVFYLFFGVLLMIVSLRILYVYPHRDELSFSFFQTHIRTDGIIIGIILGYLYHFTNYIKRILNHTKTLFFLAIICVSPSIYFTPGSYFMNTIGLTIINCGFGILLLLSLKLKFDFRFPFTNKILLLLSFIGVNSYSIYLWHLFVKKNLSLFQLENNILYNSIYIIIALLVGVVFSYGIEKNSLKWRTKIEKYIYKK